MAADNRSVKEAREDAERRKRAKISGPARKAAKAEKSKKEPEMAGDHRSVKGLEAAIKKEMKKIREARRALAKLKKDTAEPKKRSSSRSAPIAGLRKKKRVEEQDEGINIYSKLKRWPRMGEDVETGERIPDWDPRGWYPWEQLSGKIDRGREKVDKYNAALRQIRRSAKRSGGRMVWTPSKKAEADVRGKK
jgi:hypothetical protein